MNWTHRAWPSRLAFEHLFDEPEERLQSRQPDDFDRSITPEDSGRRRSPGSRQANRGLPSHPGRDTAAGNDDVETSRLLMTSGFEHDDLSALGSERPFEHGRQEPGLDGQRESTGGRR